MAKYTEKQKKGIDLAVRGIKKKYPFIKGWEFTYDFDKYTMSVYIDLLIDWFEMADFYDKKIKDYWKRTYKENGPTGLKTSSLSALMDTEGEPMFDGPTFNEMYEANKKINSDLNSMYQYLPNDFKFLRENILGELQPIDLEVDNYIQYQ